MTIKPHSHQSAPLFFLNGRSGLFAAECSSDATTEYLRKHLRREHYITDAHRLDYPPALMLNAASKKWQEATSLDLLRQIRAVTPDPVDLVAHSMGCMLAHKIMQVTGFQVFRRIVMLSPAMSHKADFRDLKFDRMMVVTNPRDRAIWWGAIIPGHPYGWAGRRGFVIEDPRIRHEEMRDVAKVDFHRHSHYFRSPQMEMLGQWVEGFLTV